MADPRDLPKARHHRASGTSTSPGLETLLRRTRLIGAGEGAGRNSFRVAGVPVLIAAVVTGGPGWTTYVVRDGDSLTGIARRHGTDPRALARINGLRDVDADGLIAGRRLSVPVPARSRSSLTRRRAAASGLHPVDTSGAPALCYRARDGDTIALIATRSGSSIRSVLAANNLRPGGVIKPGQLLVLPTLRAPRPAAGDPRPGPIHPPAEGTAAIRRARRCADGEAGFMAGSYPEAVWRAAAANRSALSRLAVPEPAQVRELIRAQARQYRVEASLALAVGSMESGFDQRQVSPANAVGVMQVLPSSGAWISGLIERRLDLLQAQDNVTAGVALLAVLTGRLDEQTALAAYYQGMTSVRRHGMFADTRRYVATVRTLKLRYR